MDLSDSNMQCDLADVLLPVTTLKALNVSSFALQEALAHSMRHPS